MEVCGKEIRTRGKIIRAAFLEGEGYQFPEDPEAAVAALRKSRPRADFFTFIQRLSETSPKYGYPMEYDNFAVLLISTFDHWWNNQIGFKARNKAKQAEKKGVVVREVPFDDDLVRSIHAIYNESPIRQGRRFPHYGKDVETLRKMKRTFLDRSIFIGAFFKDTLIGFVKLVVSEDHAQAGLMHILSMIEHRDKAPTNALVAQAVRSCAERGIPCLWYANFSYGRRQSDSLVEFKRRNGFQEVEVPGYYVPLTAAGQLALRLGLHRGGPRLDPRAGRDHLSEVAQGLVRKKIPRPGKCVGKDETATRSAPNNCPRRRRLVCPVRHEKRKPSSGGRPQCARAWYEDATMGGFRCPR